MAAFTAGETVVKRVSAPEIAAKGKVKGSEGKQGEGRKCKLL